MTEPKKPREAAEPVPSAAVPGVVPPEPENVALDNAEPHPLKAGEPVNSTWPGQVPGGGESPLDDKDRVPLVPNDIQVAVTPPDGAPQPKPQDEDPGINANVVS